MYSRCGWRYHGLVVVVPCISFILSELKLANNHYAGISDYRELQVLEKIVNAVIRDIKFATFGYFFPGVQLFSCFVAITLSHDPDANIFRIGLFVAPYLAAVTLTLVTFSVAGNVIPISGEWILRYKERSKSALSKRICRSLAPLRIQFGNNFVEQLTPLVLQEFCIRQTASLLLLSR